MSRAGNILKAIRVAFEKPGAAYSIADLHKRVGGARSHVRAAAKKLQPSLVSDARRSPLVFYRDNDVQSYALACLLADPAHSALRDLTSWCHDGVLICMLGPLGKYHSAVTPGGVADLFVNCRDDDDTKLRMQARFARNDPEAELFGRGFDHAAIKAYAPKTIPGYQLSQPRPATPIRKSFVQRFGDYFLARGLPPVTPRRAPAAFYTVVDSTLFLPSRSTDAMNRLAYGADPERAHAAKIGPAKAVQHRDRDASTVIYNPLDELAKLEPAHQRARKALAAAGLPEAAAKAVKKALPLT